MKKVIFRRFMLFIITMIVCYSCVQPPSNYYRFIELDGHFKYKGRYPVADNLADKVNCYHFLYDDKGRVTKIEYRKGGSLSEDSYFGTAIVTIEYSEGFEKWTFFNREGQAAQNSDKVYAVRLKLDNNARVVAMFNYDEADKLTKDDNGVFQYQWQLDDRGFRVISLRYDDKGNRIFDNQGVLELRFKYDKDGNQIETRQYGVHVLETVYSELLSRGFLTPAELGDYNTF